MPSGEILDFLSQHKGGRVALVTHQRPDGDAIGSALGMAELLHMQGYAAKVVTPLPLPSFLHFLTKDSLLASPAVPEWWRDYDCLGVLDCGEAGRLDTENQPAPLHLPTFTIDHHASSDGLGSARWIEPTASATGEMVVRLAALAGWPLTPFVAQALWTAIVTDTGRFSYENTTITALEAAVECVKAGAEPATVATELYQSVTVPERRLQTVVLERMELLEDGRMATSWLLREDFREAGVGSNGAQDLVNILRDTAGVQVAVFFYEPPDSTKPHEVKASFRTRSPYDALHVVSRFGGGGHQRAAGCSLFLPMAEAKELVTKSACETFFK